MSESTPAKTQAIPDMKDKANGTDVSAEEREEYEAYREGKDNLYHAGIRVGEEGFYDPTAGSAYKDQKEKRPAQSAQDSDMPKPNRKSAENRAQKRTPAKVISREKNGAVDGSERVAEAPKKTGRKVSDKGLDK